MYHIVSTAKSVDDAARDLEEAVRKHSFGVLHVHDLKETLTKKGYPLGPECRIFEVCNPREATRVLQRDMRLNMALPCRISVFEDEGSTRIGTILPTEMLSALADDDELRKVAASVEAAIKAIIDDAAAPAEPRTSLLRRRAALTAELAAGAEKRAADRGGNVPDSGEIAADAVARDIAIAEIDRDAAELAAIDAALERLDAGSYGRCVECGASIAPARLAQHPEAARCVPCQQRREQRSAPRLTRS